MENKEKKSTFRAVCELVFRLRGLLLSIPVMVVAGYLAWYNAGHLPPVAGLLPRADGTFVITMAKNTAVLLPLGVTGLCILLTVISKKVTYPWMISIFSLILPLVILFSGMI